MLYGLKILGRSGRLISIVSFFVLFLSSPLLAQDDTLSKEKPFIFLKKDDFLIRFDVCTTKYSYVFDFREIVSVNPRFQLVRYEFYPVRWLDYTSMKVEGTSLKYLKKYREWDKWFFMEELVFGNFIVYDTLKRDTIKADYNNTIKIKNIDFPKKRDSVTNHTKKEKK